MRGICEKPRIKCAACQHRRFLSVTDVVIRWHLSGHDDAGQPFVAGVYPLMQDEMCWLLAIDFDKANWHDDAMAFLETCDMYKSAPPSNGRAPDAVATCGSSSRRPFRQRWLAVLDPIS